MSLLQDELLPSLEFLLHLERDEQFRADCFDIVFAIGPNGVQPAIELLYLIFTTLQHVQDGGLMSLDDYLIHVETLEATYARPLLALVLHFRSTANRAEYDPQGFSSLRLELQTPGRNKFGVRGHILINSLYFSDVVPGCR